MKIPLYPPLKRGNCFLIPLFEKEGPGEIFCGRIEN
jgi:hypothetical protein